MTSHIILLPLSKEINNEVSSEFLGENLREEVEIGNKGSLENNGNVRGIEQLDGVWLLVTLHFSTANSKFHSETLY